MSCLAQMVRLHGHINDISAIHFSDRSIRVWIMKSVEDKEHK